MLKKKLREINFFLLFLGYLLTPDPELRPDIYQASYLAFKIFDSNNKCPVQNLNKAKKPCFEDISLENSAESTTKSTEVKSSAGPPG